MCQIIEGLITFQKKQKICFLLINHGNTELDFFFTVGINVDAKIICAPLFPILLLEVSSAPVYFNVKRVHICMCYNMYYLFSLQYYLCNMLRSNCTGVHFNQALFWQWADLLSIEHQTTTSEDSCLCRQELLEQRNSAILFPPMTKQQKCVS